jgi:hypothetical protein
MKIQYLIIFLIMEIFVSEGQAMSPKKGGASGQDISSCKIDYKGNGKVSIQKEREKPSLMCVGKAICGGKEIPVSCSLPSESATCDQARSCSPLSTGAELPRGTVLKAENIPIFEEIKIISEKKDSRGQGSKAIKVEEIIELMIYNTYFNIARKVVGSNYYDMVLNMVGDRGFNFNFKGGSCNVGFYGMNTTYWKGYHLIGVTFKSKDPSLGADTFGIGWDFSCGEIRKRKESNFLIEDCSKLWKIISSGTRFDVSFDFNKFKFESCH